MPKVSSPRCRGCGAPIPIEDGRSIYDCRFCGRRNSIEQDERSETAPTSTSGKGTSKLVPFLMAGVAIAMTLFSGLAVLLSSGGSDSGGSLESAAQGLLGGGRFQWDGTAPPVLVEHGEGTLIVGRIRRGNNMHVAAFDALSQRLKWQTPSWGDWSERFQHTHLGAAAGRLAITHPDSTVTIHDLENGELKQQLGLTDRSIGACAATEEQGKVWIGVADEQDVLVELATGDTGPGSLPSGCHDPRDVFSDCPPGPSHGATCDSSRLPEVPGASLSSALILDDLAVALGRRSPGTATPVLAGFDPEDLSVLWTRQLREMHPNVRTTSIDLFEMAGGRVYTEIELEDGTRRLVSLDARTGRVVFDIAYPHADEGTGASSIRVHEGRVYISRWTWLHILDTETGAHLATIGRWI